MSEYAVITTGRCGSNLLMHMIGQIEGIAVYGEIFYSDHCTETQIDRTLAVMDRGGSFTYKLRGDQAQPFQKALVSRPRTKLIFLYRESLFDLAMSWVLALRANSTMDYPGRIKAGIAIKPYIVKDRIKLLREQMDRYDGFYRGCTNPKLLLRYPDFIEEQEPLKAFFATRKKLGVGIWVKQSGPAVYSKIVNYQKLKAEFGNEVWKPKSGQAE